MFSVFPAAASAQTSILDAVNNALAAVPWTAVPPSGQCGADSVKCDTRKVLPGSTAAGSLCVKRKVGELGCGSCTPPANIITARCDGTRVVVVQCAVGWRDADGNGANGCEVRDNLARPPAAPPASGPTPGNATAPAAGAGKTAIVALAGAIDASGPAVVMPGGANPARPAWLIPARAKVAPTSVWNQPEIPLDGIYMVFDGPVGVWGESIFGNAWVTGGVWNQFANSTADWLQPMYVRGAAINYGVKEDPRAQRDWSGCLRMALAMSSAPRGTSLIVGLSKVRVSAVPNPFAATPPRFDDFVYRPAQKGFGINADWEWGDPRRSDRLRIDRPICALVPAGSTVRLFK